MSAVENVIPDNKPTTLTELLSAVYVTERAKFAAEPDWQGAWDRAGERERAFAMGAMVEVVRQLGLLGVHVTLTTDEHGAPEIVVKAVNDSPKRFGVIQNTPGGGTLVTMPAGEPPVNASVSRHLGYTGNLCEKCGSAQMVRSGACEKCENCGESSGCS